MKYKRVGGRHGESRVRVDDLPNQYSYIMFTMIDGDNLFFNDMRQFGYVRLVNEKELEEELGSRVEVGYKGCNKMSRDLDSKRKGVLNDG